MKKNLLLFVVVLLITSNIMGQNWQNCAPETCMVHLEDGQWLRDISNASINYDKEGILTGIVKVDRWGDSLVYMDPKPSYSRIYINNLWLSSPFLGETPENRDYGGKMPLRIYDTGEGKGLNCFLIKRNNLVFLIFEKKDEGKIKEVLNLLIF